MTRNYICNVIVKLFQLNYYFNPNLTRNRTLSYHSNFIFVCLSKRFQLTILFNFILCPFLLTSKTRLKYINVDHELVASTRSCLTRGTQPFNTNDQFSKEAFLRTTAGRENKIEHHQLYRVPIVPVKFKRFALKSSSIRKALWCFSERYLRRNNPIMQSSRSLIQRVAPIFAARIRHNSRLLSSTSSSVLAKEPQSSSPSPTVQDSVYLSDNCVRVLSLSSLFVYIDL